ncbi:30S ribosomal protein S13 [Chlamydiota bacterium]
MPRIVGIDVPKNKRIEIALTSILGVGRTLAKKILEQAKIDGGLRADKLSEEQVAKISMIIAKEYRVEGDLQREVAQNVKRLIGIGSYRGYRHRKGLPVRGQRTHTNARTRKGPRKAIAGKKKTI